LLRKRSWAAWTCIAASSTSLRRAFCSWLSKLGRATLDRMPAIETVIISSINVKPRWAGVRMEVGMVVLLGFQQAR